MKTIVYVDGFNLYFGALKNTPYRWLNVAAMCQTLLPGDEILRINYFTALVDPRPGDPDKRSRQQTFLRALSTIPELSIHYGFFLTHEVTMPRVGGGFAKVIKTEEKGSDVNLATHLLVDAFTNAFELAVIISNDSDLLGPIRVVSERLGKQIGLLNPQKHVSITLVPHVRFVKHIRAGVLAKCQFPQVVSDVNGSFSKPMGW